MSPADHVHTHVGRYAYESIIDLYFSI